MKSYMLLTTFTVLTIVILTFILESIQDNRADRLAEDGILANAANVDKLKLKENVLGRNLSPSLQGK